MKLLLLYPPYKEGTLLFSLPCLYSYLKQYADVKVIDCPSEGINLRELIDKTASFNPDIIGVSIPSTVMFNSALKTIKALKKNFPSKLIVVGGIHATLCPEELTPYCDFGIVGEGEQPLKELLQGKKPQEKIIYGNKLDLDSLPFIDWNCIPYKKHNSKYNIARKKRMKYMPLFGSKGCVFNCYFCSNWVISGRKMSYKSVDYLIKEIKYLLSTYNTKYLFFTDEVFTLDKARAAEICNKIIENNLKFSWICQTRAHLVDPELLALMKKAGCDTISFGVESGNEEILKKIDKGETKQQIIDGVRLVKQAGIKVYGGFIIGHYWDNIKTVLQTIKFADKLDLDCPNFHIATPFPKTKLAELIGDKLNKDYSRYITNDVVYVPEGLKHYNLRLLRRFAHLYFYLRRPRRAIPLIMRRLTRFIR